MHQELQALRSQADTRLRVPLVEPMTLMPDGFGKKNGPELENLVVPGERLRRRCACDAEAGDDGRRESDATDLCDAFST